MDVSEKLTFEHFSSERDRKLYLDGYVEAYQESFPGAPLPPAVRIGLAASVEDMGRPDPHRVAITAVHGSMPIGFVVVSTGAFYVVPMGRIEALYISPQFRRRGFARALIDQATSWAKFNGARFVRLDVTPSNGPALALYESYGFTVTRYEMDASVA
jgi:ribosomal protein S18 acetylase RimI-like enzyme